MSASLISHPAQYCYSASTPGKVILCGEYSVMDGSQALVFAVNRRLSIALLSSGPHSECIIDINAHGYVADPGRFIWKEDDRRFVAACLSETPWQFLLDALNVLCAGKTLRSAFLTQHWQMTIDSRALFHRDHKLGLGSSAALVTALDTVLNAALSPSSNDASPASRWPRVQQAHCVAQGKRGSGSDVAASLHGGRFVFRPGVDQLSCELTAYQQPESLYFAFFWSGVSASTSRYLRSLEAWKASHSACYRDHMKGLFEGVDGVTSAHNAADFLVSLSEFTRVLKRLDDQSGIGIFSNGHDQLYAHSCTSTELIYKPCGAGGGDLGVAVSDDPEQLSDFVRVAKSHHFELLSLASDPQGSLSHATHPLPSPQ